MKLSHRPLFQKIIENSGWQIGDRAIRLGLNFFITAWIARYLGPESYGKLSYVIAFVSIFQVFSSLGIEWIVLKEFSAAGPGDSSAGKLITTVKLRFLTGIIGQGLLLAIVRNIGGESSITIMATAQSFLLLLQAFDTIDFWFQSRMEVRRVVLIRTLGFLVASGLRVFFLVEKYPLEAFTLPFLIEAVVANVLLVKAYWGEVGGVWKLLKSFDADWVVRLMGKLPVLFLTAIALQMYLRIDQLLLQWLSGPVAVGIFSIPVRLSEIFYMIGSAVISSAAPALFAAHAAEPVVFRDRMSRLFRTLNGMSFVICVLVVLLAEPVVLLVFGDKYAGSVSVLRIYIWCLPAVLQGGIRNIWLMAEGRTGFALFAASIGIGLSLALNFVLIPIYGVEGAAISAVVAMWASGIFSSFFHHELKPIVQMQMASFLPWRTS